MWLGTAVNQEGEIVTHPLDKEVIGDFREPLSSLLQVDRSHLEYCLTQVTKIAGEMKRRRGVGRGGGGGGGRGEERGRKRRDRRRRRRRGVGGGGEGGRRKRRRGVGGGGGEE